METSSQASPHDSITIRAPGGDGRRHSLVIVTDGETSDKSLESSLATATSRGLDRIATLIRRKIAERDEQLLGRALDTIDRDFELAGALVQFAVVEGVLRCRAFVEAQEEDALIRALGRIPGVRRIAIDVVLPPGQAARRTSEAE